MIRKVFKFLQSHFFQNLIYRFFTFSSNYRNLKHLQRLNVPEKMLKKIHNFRIHFKTFLQLGEDIQVILSVSNISIVTNTNYAFYVYDDFITKLSLYIFKVSKDNLHSKLFLTLSVSTKIVLIVTKGISDES